VSASSALLTDTTQFGAINEMQQRPLHGSLTETSGPPFIDFSLLSPVSSDLYLTLPCVVLQMSLSIADSHCCVKWCTDIFEEINRALRSAFSAEGCVSAVSHCFASIGRSWVMCLCILHGFNATLLQALSEDIIGLIAALLSTLSIIHDQIGAGSGGTHILSVVRALGNFVSSSHSDVFSRPESEPFWRAMVSLCGSVASCVPSKGCSVEAVALLECLAGIAVQFRPAASVVSSVGVAVDLTASVVRCYDSFLSCLPASSFNSILLSKLMSQMASNVALAVTIDCDDGVMVGLPSIKDSVKQLVASLSQDRLIRDVLLFLSLHLVDKVETAKLSSLIGNQQSVLFFLEDVLGSSKLVFTSCERELLSLSLASHLQWQQGLGAADANAAATIHRLKELAQHISPISLGTVATGRGRPKGKQAARRPIDSDLDESLSPPFVVRLWVLLMLWSCPLSRSRGDCAASDSALGASVFVSNAIKSLRETCSSFGTLSPEAQSSQIYVLGAVLMGSVGATFSVLSSHGRLRDQVRERSSVCEFLCVCSSVRVGRFASLMSWCAWSPCLYVLFYS
jgi:hypothetical protein